MLAGSIPDFYRGQGHVALFNHSCYNTCEMINKVIIDQIKKAAKDEPQILSVYIFGSYAKGVAKKGSDFDIAFVVKDKKTFSDDEAYAILRPTSFPADVDFMVVDKGTNSLLLFEIISFGKRIYEKSEEEALTFEAYVLKTYYDTAHIRNIYYQYLKDKFPPRQYVS